MKKFKKLLLLSSLVGLLSPISAYAYIGEGYEPSNPLTWNQLDSEVRLGNSEGVLLNGKSGLPFPLGADSVFVYSFLAIKTNTMRLGYEPWTANYDLTNKGYVTDDGLIDFNANGILMGWTKLNQDKYFTEATYQDAINSWNNGNLVIMVVKNDNYTTETPDVHFVAIDFIEGGRVLTYSPLKKGYTFHDMYSEDDVVGIIEFTSTIRSDELDSLFNNQDNLSEYFKSSYTGAGLPNDKDSRLAKQISAQEAKNIKESSSENSDSGFVFEELEESQKEEVTNYVLEDDLVEEVSEETKEKPLIFSIAVGGLGVVVCSLVVGLVIYLKRRGGNAKPEEDSQTVDL